ncbi:MAG TPA: NHLP-related RiPP peptide [Stenotrophomonas sp.]
MPTLKLDVATANKLIELLAADDEFRDLFATDTLAALEQVGQTPTEELKLFVSECCSRVTLADKSVIAGAKDKILAMLTSGGNQTVPALDANQAGGRTLK